MIPPDEAFYQDFTPQNLPSPSPSRQINSDIEFKKKAIKQLHLRSLCLANTEQYAKFMEKLSINGGNISMSDLESVFGFSFVDYKSEIKHKDDFDSAIFNFLKEKQLQNKIEIDIKSEKNNSMLISSTNSTKNLKMKEESAQTQTSTYCDSSRQGSLFDWIPSLPSVDHPSFDKSLRKELKKVVKMILTNMGKDNNKVIENSRGLYTHNTFLIQTYDVLVRKYHSSVKSKEDIVRYIFRKMLKLAKKPIKETEKVKGKKASILLCKRYFPHYFNFTDGNTEKNEQELLESLMPFSQKSKNKTMNINFVQEMFSSETFLKDYQEFLLKIEYLLEEDNKKKLTKLLDTLVQCVRNNNFKNIGSLKVFPWLDTWIQDTKSTAFELWQKKAYNPPRKQRKL